MRQSSITAVLLLSLALPGCAMPIYVVGTHGPGHEEDFDPQLALCVAKSPEAAASELDREIARKIEVMLERQGYRTVPSNEADAYVFFDYRIKALLARSRFQPTSGIRSGIETVRREGPFVHTLALRVVDADGFRDRGEEDIFWQGGAVFNEVPTHSTRFHDLLLVAAFELFPRNVEGTVKLKIRLNDQRAKPLRYVEPDDS